MKTKKKKDEVKISNSTCDEESSNKHFNGVKKIGSMKELKWMTLASFTNRCAVFRLASKSAVLVVCATAIRCRERMQRGVLYSYKFCERAF